jgi:hypothetical protein
VLERILGIAKDWSKSTFAGRWARRILIFHLVCLTWIFFRADSISAALTFVRGVGVWHWEPSYTAAAKFLAIFSLPLFLLDLYLEATGDEYVWESRPHFQRVAVALTAVLAIAFFGANQANAFIYFQF